MTHRARDFHRRVALAALAAEAAALAFVFTYL